MCSLYSTVCPIESCKKHFKIIICSLKDLQNHIFFDHDYQQKLQTAFNLGIISNITDHRSALWLSEELALMGVIKAES